MLLRNCCTWLFFLGNLSVAFSQQPAKEQFYISIYSPPPADFLNEEQYAVMKEAHIDFIFNIGPGVSTDKEGNLKTLDMARKHGLYVYVFDARISQSESKIREMVADYRGHPALAGYYLTDEPDSARLQSVIDLHRLVTGLAPEKDSYVNHLPDWAVNDYEHGFMERWIQGVGPQNLNYLAYDNYPFKRKQRYEKTYYNNLDIIRRLGLKYGIKTSSCLQSFGMAFNDVEELRRPNPDEMRLNVYSNLAYGIKNAVWYPYWSKYRHTEIITMDPCIIHDDGRKTDLYAAFKALNGEMKQLGKTLIQLDAMEVYHTGDSLWIGTRHPPDEFIASVAQTGSDLILSRFTDRNTGKSYLMVVNKSYQHASPFTLQLAASVRSLREVSKTDGRLVRTAYQRNNHRLSGDLLPGEGRLYALNP